MNNNRAVKKVLFVDDEILILESIKRDLYDYYDIITATSAEEGLEILKNEPNIIVVVSDMRMEKMDGITFLSKVKNMYPNVIKAMLTGNADVQDAINAVNSGNIFRFLQKPCKSSDLIRVINACFQQYNLKNAEKILLEKTFNALIKVMIEMLELGSLVESGRVKRIRNICIDLAKALKLEDLWIIDTAAMLSQIGLITLPDEIIMKINNGEFLTEEEEKIYSNHPKIGYDLIRQIPRLERVATIILNQNIKQDATCIQINDEKAYEVCAASILRVAIDYDRIHSRGLEHLDIMEELRSNKKPYNALILDALDKPSSALKFIKQVKKIPVRDLCEGMVIEEDVKSLNGILIIKKGNVVTEPLKQKLQNQVWHYKLKDEVLISDIVVSD